jgi:hypothetical protein
MGEMSSSDDDADPAGGRPNPLNQHIGREGVVRCAPPVHEPGDPPVIRFGRESVGAVPPKCKLTRVWSLIVSDDDKVFHRWLKFPMDMFWREFTKLHPVMRKYRDQTPYKLDICVVDFWMWFERCASGCTYDDQGKKLDLSKSACHRAFTRTLQALAVFVRDKRSIPVQEVLAHCGPEGFPHFPHCFFAVDGTHFCTDGPKALSGMTRAEGWDRQKLMYDRKHHAWTGKVLIMCDCEGRICFFSEVYTGATHDMKVFEDSGVSDYAKLDFPDAPVVYIMADKGYIGARHSDQLIVPTKKPPRNSGRRLTGEQLRDNSAINSDRVVVEHLNAKVKEKFLILNSGKMEGDHGHIATTILGCLYFAMIWTWQHPETRGGRAPGGRG